MIPFATPPALSNAYDHVKLAPLHLPEQGLSYFSIPKNGGTTIWNWIHYIRTGAFCGDNVYHQDWLQEGSLQKETFIIRRDPVERLISGFRNFRDKRGLTLDFPEFLERLPQLMAQDGNYLHHFRLQSSYYSLPLEQFDHVFDFEDFPRIKQFLEERFGREIPDLHDQKSRFDQFEVTDEQIELIQKYYVNDYIAGYGDIVDDEGPSQA